MRSMPDRPIDPPEPDMDQFLAEVEARKEREYTQEQIARRIMRGEDDSFWGQSENADALFAVIRRFLRLRVDSEKKWELTEAALRGLAQEWSVFQTSDDK